MRRIDYAVYVQLNLKMRLQFEAKKSILKSYEDFVVDQLENQLTFMGIIGIKVHPKKHLKHVFNEF